MGAGKEGKREREKKHSFDAHFSVTLIVSESVSNSSTYHTVML